MNVEEIFNSFFVDYCLRHEKMTLSYVVTSRYRPGGLTNPHACRGNALDFTLRVNKSFAPIREYNELFRFMILKWPYRAGIDNTERVTKAGYHPNVHIHIDLGLNRPEGQEMPFFFIEDNGKYSKRILTPEEI